MNNIYRSLLLMLSLITLAVWYTKRKKPVPQTTIDTLIVGTNATFPPFSFIEDNTIVGLDIDIAKEVAQRLKRKIIIKNMPFNVLIPEIQLGNIQVIAAGMSPTAERAKRVLFTEPHLEGNPLVIVMLATNPPVKGVTDLAGKDVVVNEGYVSDLYMSDIEGPNLIRLSSESVGDGILSLKSRRAYAFVSAQTTVGPFFKKYDKKEFHIIPIPGTDESDSLAVSKKCPALFKQIQTIMNEMKKDGTLQAMKQKWELA